jgi:DNA-binding SARP family transcriptional activator
VPPPPDTSGEPRHLLVVASAGYGKTAAVRAAVGAAPARWLPAGRLAAADLAAPPVGGAGWLVVDDAPRPHTPAGRALAAALVAALAGLPAGLRMAVTSRWPQDALARRLGHDGVTELGPAALALPAEAVGALLADRYGLASPGLGDRVHEATAGWPALVHLAGQALATHGVPAGPLADALAVPGGPVAGYVTAEVLGPLPAELRRLVATVAPFAPVTPGLGAALGARRAAGAVALLARVGLLEPGPRRRVVPLVAQVAAGEEAPAARRGRARTAAAWYTEHGPPAAAARAHLRAGDPAAAAAALVAAGPELLGSGAAAEVADAVRALPAGRRDTPLHLLLGDALRVLGDVAGAQAAYRDAAAGARPDDPAVCWRTGIVDYLRGDPAAALAAYGRARPDPGPDGALLLTWAAAAHLMLGDAPAALDRARRAVATAAATGDDRALAACHVTLAMALGLGGDPAASDAEFAAALRTADRVGDLLLITRIHTNRAHRLLDEARYPDALATAARAVAAARDAGHANLLSIAMGNEARALAALGRYDEAVERYERVVRAAAGLGSRRVATALLGLGDAHRWRGWHEQARAAYEEAVRVSAGCDAPVQVKALAGLARVLAPRDPVAAARHAADALHRATSDSEVPALLAAAAVALQRGDPAGAAEAAGRAASAARRARHRAGLAEALELQAAADARPARARAALAEAHAIWRDAGAATHADRALVALGRLPGAGTEDRLDALLARERLAAADVLDVDGPGAPAHPAVAVRVLGRFEVYLAGEAVPASAWQSRKARDLLRVLVARRGRPVPRPELSELLWPDDDPARTGHRLSVLLSIVRQVVEPDGGPDGVVIADAGSVALDVGRLDVDVERLLADVGHARRLRERGEPAAARTLLAAAVKQYGGEAFEDDPYADWARPLREEARAAYLGALRGLAALCRAAGDTEEAVGHLRRILEADPYDEAAHRAMVRSFTAAGRHGEARRAFERYAGAMRAIGVATPGRELLGPA